ncbi:uncharacterized protein LOC117117669, partial [Anneissia japonica]|uniref:uncharacterized protein LOC117117669 n=1 Tax=Anneissia japonica TaxID=1529436 RepID=UPI0014255B5C
MGKFCDGRSMCPSFSHTTNTSIEGRLPDEPIQNVTISHYSAQYIHDDGYVLSNTFTGLNISFDLDPAGYGLYQGAIIEITGIAFQRTHFGQRGCFFLSFDGVLNRSAVILSNNKIKRIFFDCARQLAPATTYLITIKMAPFLSKDFKIYYQIP